MMDDEEIEAVVRRASPEDAGRKLVQMARERGGYDSITVAVVVVEAAGCSPQPVKDTRQAEVKLRP
jgi:serine/threonine protein phosphatase PrpC